MNKQPVGISEKLNTLLLAHYLLSEIVQFVGMSALICRLVIQCKQTLSVFAFHGLRSVTKARTFKSLSSVICTFYSLLKLPCTFREKIFVFSFF